MSQMPADGPTQVPAGTDAPRPPDHGRASAGKVLLIVVAAVLLLTLAGGALLMLSGRTATPVNPQVTIQSSPLATQPSEELTPEPDPAGGLVDLGNGVMFLPAAGWQVQEQVPNAISVSDGDAVFVTRVIRQKKNTNPAQLCDAFNRQVLQETAGARFGDPQDLSVNLPNLAIAQCPAAFISTANGRTIQMLVVSFAAVRTTDGVTTLSTMLFTKDTPDASFSDIDQMLSIVLTSQSVGE